MCRVCYLCGNMRSVCVLGYENAVCGGVCCLCVSWVMSCLPMVCAYVLCAVSLILCATVYCMGDCLSDILWHVHITYDILCRGCVLPHVGVLVLDVCMSLYIVLWSVMFHCCVYMSCDVCMSYGHNMQTVLLYYHLCRYCVYHVLCYIHHVMHASMM